MYVYRPSISINSACHKPVLLHTYVDLRVLKSFLEVLVDGLVRDLAEQREVRHSNLLLLRALEHRLLDLGPPSITSARRLFRITGILLPSRTLGNRLLFRISVELALNW